MLLFIKYHVRAVLFYWPEFTITINIIIIIIIINIINIIIIIIIIITVIFVNMWLNISVS